MVIKRKKPFKKGQPFDIVTRFLIYFAYVGGKQKFPFSRLYCNFFDFLILPNLFDFL